MIVQLQNETFVAELAAQLEYNLPVPLEMPVALIAHH